jgi:UDP-N-acetylglucosamine 1-carboxyvinyltransferase
MSYIEIQGGKKLTGAINNQSAKNSALALLCAALMIKGKTTLTDMPIIDEVDKMLILLESIGVKITRIKKDVLVLDASAKLNLDLINKEACKIRSSLFLFGALAWREKKYRLYKTGGCKLGNRTVRPHIYALKKLGVEIESHDGYYDVLSPKLNSANIVMYESGDVATENAILAAVYAPGKTTIKMASANYMVQDLCYFLVKAGAKISGIGTTTLKITGVKKLKTSISYAVMPDPIVAMTYISIACTTGSYLVIKNCPLEFLELELCKLEIMGQKYNLKNKRKSKNNKFDIVDVEIIPSQLNALPDKLECRPFPGLNIDNLPLFVPILTQARGRTLVHDWVFENRSIYALELQKLGAQITLLDPHRIWVEGPTKFVPNEIICPPALRPAVNILICMLAAPGKSILRNTDMIDRGYENIYEILNQVGAEIRVVNDK